VVVNGLNFFGQDSWQVTPRLNLNLGLRWDYFGPLHNDKKDLAVFIPAAGGIKIQGNGINAIFPGDKNNIAPRIGFAYQPTAKNDVVVRGGIGVYYDQINMNPFLDFRPPNNADGLEDNPAGPHPVSIYTASGYTWQPNQYIFPGISTCVTGNVATDPNCGTSVFDVFSVSQNFRTPYFYNYNLNVQKSFGNGAVLQVGYVGSQGRKLSIMLNVNQFGQLTPQFPNYGGVNQLNSIGTSNYNALQATFRTRAWHGFSSQFAYTWAHALDEITAYRGAIPLDSTNLKAEYGNGDFDTRHNLSGTFTWEIPGSSHGPKILTHGWQLNSLLTIHGGQPLDQVRTGLNKVGDPLAGVSHSFHKSGVTWTNPAAFCSPFVTNPITNTTVADPGCTPNTLLGTLRRNQVYGPGFGDFDLSVLKNIPITERVKLQFRAEFFNLFNRVNLASGTGGTITGYGGQCTPSAFTPVTGLPACPSGNVSHFTTGGVDADTIGDFNGAPGIGPGEAFNAQFALKITF
jgi:hypothetical protein